MKMKLSDIIDSEGKVNSEIIKKNRWLYYLVITSNNSVNYERVNSVDKVKGTETLEYVLRTLDILEKEHIDGLSDYQYSIIKKVLQWSEVAKGGTDKQREEWRNKGYALDIHNLASAEIYLDESTDNVKDTKLIYTLIKTHGIIGQNIRGEVGYCENFPLIELLLKYGYGRTSLESILTVLNHCIIGAISEQLWGSIYLQVKDIIENICQCKFKELDTLERLKALMPSIKNISPETINLFKKNIFPYFEMWYFTPVAECFTEDIILALMKKILEDPSINKASYINFKPLANSLYYDYENKKHVNIYKQRIIEKYLKFDNVKDVELIIRHENRALMVDFKFSPACSKLIEFCIEAERSHLLTYESSINMLYETFEFKRDKFDRLNNERKYLDTMNECAETKKEIADYVVGKTVVDVGSGGGFMLDLLERRYSNIDIIGTDISQNVIEELENKRLSENHRWELMKHNFVESPLKFKVDTIIFSSILHEIYSYTCLNGGKFNILSVKDALNNAFASLNKRGRIIIRDGIKSKENEQLEFQFKDEEGIKFLERFSYDFKGLKGEDHSYEVDGLKVKGNKNFLREFLYTYTWGIESYAHEVQEQFGYMTLQQFKNFFTNINGAKIIAARQFLEYGYYEHLSRKIYLPMDKYPDSNCIIVVEKTIE